MKTYKKWENGTSIAELRRIMEDFYRMNEFEKGIVTMYDRAKEIQDLADSDFASDPHLTEMSEKFKADFGCDWTEIVES